MHQLPPELRLPISAGELRLESPWHVPTPGTGRRAARLTKRSLGEVTLPRAWGSVRARTDTSERPGTHTHTHTHTHSSSCQPRSKPRHGNRVRFEFRPIRAFCLCVRRPRLITIFPVEDARAAREAHALVSVRRAHNEYGRVTRMPCGSGCRTLHKHACVPQHVHVALAQGHACRLPGCVRRGAARRWIERLGEAQGRKGGQRS